MTGNEGPKQNIAERGVRFLRNVHIAIGAVALAGAVVFPEAAPLLLPLAGYDGINALVHEGLRQSVKTRPKHRAAVT